MRYRSARASSSLDGIHLFYLRHHLTQPGFDALTQRDGGSTAARAGAAQTQQQHPIRFVEVHYLHLAAVRGDVGPEGVEGFLDAGESIWHRGNIAVSYRSEERRVGKECRSRGWVDDGKEN